MVEANGDNVARSGLGMPMPGPTIGYTITLWRYVPEASHNLLPVDHSRHHQRPADDNLGNTKASGRALKETEGHAKGHAEGTHLHVPGLLLLAAGIVCNLLCDLRRRISESLPSAD